MFGQYFSRMGWNISLVILVCLFLVRSESRSIFIPGDTKQMHLIVAVHSKVPHDIAGKNGGLVKSIKSLLNATSSALFTATRNNQYIEEVTILIPYYLKDDFKTAIPATYETFAEADIQVEDHSHNDAPYTVRSEGCGKPGRAVHLSPNFIKSTTKENREANAKLLVRELAFYQYGVFDECGYRLGAQYPPFYYKNNKLQPTGCATKPSETFQGGCQISNHTGLPNPADCENVSDEHHGTSSIMYQPTWSNANHFCDIDSHDSEAPTKQNVLCDGQSTWDVIKKNPKFDIVDLPPTTDIIPTFKIVYESNPNYFILLDETLKMATNQKFGAVQTGLSYFFTNDAPTGSGFGIGTIADSLMTKREVLTITDDSVKSSLKNAIPDNVQQIADANIENGIKVGSEKLEGLPRGTLILITAGKWMIPIDATLCETLTTKKLRLVTILCPDSPEELNPDVKDSLHRLTSCSNGKIFVIPAISAENYPSTVERFKLALRKSLQPNELPQENIEIYEKHYPGSATSEIVGNFILDKSLGQDPRTTFRVTYHASKNVETVTLNGSDGTHHDDSDANEYEKEPTRQEVGYRFNMREGVWTYNIKLYNGLEKLPVVVTVSSIPDTQQTPITVNVWTNAHSEVYAKQTPVIIYAEVKQGHDIIADAEVTATIYAPNSTLPPYELQLFDNGNGDPDITSRDGIYSRYFTELTTPGYYAIYVRVTGIDGKTLVIEKVQVQSETANSAICSEPQYREVTKTGEFQRLAIGSAFYVKEPLTMDTDIYPPSRITDLTVVNIIPKTATFTLEWTEPGEDYDKGVVDRYEIRYSKSRSELLAPQFASATLFTNLQPNPQSAGSKMSVVVKLPFTYMNYYIAVRAIDKNNNQSPVSNIIAAYYPPIPITTPSPGNGTAHFNETLAGDKGEKTANIGPIIGIVIGALLLLVILVIVWRVTSNRRNKKQKQQPPLNTKESQDKKRKDDDGEGETKPLSENQANEDDEGGFNAKNNTEN